METAYLLLNIPRLKKAIDRLVERLKPVSNTFDSIAFRGVSGALVAPAVAVQLGKGLVVVRVSKRSNHSGRMVEGSTKKRYIIIDDFISMGETVTKIITEIKKWRKEMECIGIYTYNPSNQKTNTWHESIEKLYRPDKKSRATGKYG